MNALIEPSIPVEAEVIETGPAGVSEQEECEVKAWLQKIARAKAKWQDRFDEMRDNMDFVGGFQWPNQSKLHDDKYINNITLRLVNQKVSTLYAKNPKVTVERRERMNYQIWDGRDLSEVADAIEILQSGVPDAMLPAMALLQDIEEGRLREKIEDRIAETLQKALQWQIDNHNPDFKEQMKQLVRRVIICKVGYVKLSLCRTDSPAYDSLSTTEVDNSAQARQARAQFLMDELQSGEIDENSPEVGEIKSLLMSLGATQLGLDTPQLAEKLEFDFPQATSIIPSEECRNLKDFIAATFVAQEYEVEKELVEALFGVEITSTEDDVEKTNAEQDSELLASGEKPVIASKVLLYEVFNPKTKQRFFVAKGNKGYILPPEPLDPQITGFWPIFALTFNDIEGQAGTKAGIFPPSDVDLVRNIQKEWNRTRDALRDQRNANAPKYMCRDGTLSDEDKERIKNAEPNNVICLSGAAPDADLSKIFVPVPVNPIVREMYDTAPLEQDMMMSIGMQQANVGPAEADVTATVGTIAEQSRLSGVSSNVDDLDCLLTKVMKAGVEIILRAFSPETVKRTVGIGGTLPTTDLDDYLMAVNINIVAGSSGKPNQALETNRLQTLVPLLLQAGANPTAIITEIVRRWDDFLDVDKFFPVLPAIAGGVVGAGAGPGQESGPASSTPPQQNLSPGQQAQGLQSSNAPTQP